MAWRVTGKHAREVGDGQLLAPGATVDKIDKDDPRIQALLSDRVLVEIKESKASKPKAAGKRADTSEATDDKSEEA